jgi:hypothetical protein
VRAFHYDLPVVVSGSTDPAKYHNIPDFGDRIGYTGNSRLLSSIYPPGFTGPLNFLPAFTGQPEWQLGMTA